MRSVVVEVNLKSWGKLDRSVHNSADLALLVIAFCTGFCADAPFFPELTMCVPFKHLIPFH